MTPEGKVKRKLDEWLKLNMPGVWRYRTVGGAFGKGGVGDYIIVWSYTPVMIEVKADEDGQATDLQMRELKSFNEAGGISCLLKGFQVHKLEMIKAICWTRGQVLIGAEESGAKIRP